MPSWQNNPFAGPALDYSWISDVGEKIAGGIKRKQIKDVFAGWVPMQRGVPDYLTLANKLFRLDVGELLKQPRRPAPVRWVPEAKALRRPIIAVGHNDPIRSLDGVLPRTRGFRVHLIFNHEAPAIGSGTTHSLARSVGNGDTTPSA